MPPSGREKRSKIRLACTNCREDKTKCDGKRPICTRCRKRRGSVTCVYRRPASETRRIPRAELAELLQQRESSHQPPDSARDEYPVSSRRHECRRFAENQVSPEIVYQSASPALPNGKQDLQTRDSLATVPLGEDTDALYGGSSTIALLRHVAPGVHSQPTRSGSNDGVRADGWQHSHVQSQSSVTYPEVIREKDTAMATNPQREDADNFVQCFFEFVHPLFPVLHQPSFEAQYESVWLPGDHSRSRAVVSVEEDYIFSTTLNLVFALGCQYSSLVPRARRSSLADEFYQQSRKHLVFEILDANSLPLVQLLLLKGIYLQSSRYPTRFWNVVGLAIRAAQSLGLHLDIESRTQLSREMRRRVWHVCVCLDRLLSMSFGRPNMIGKSWNVPVPSMTDDEYLLDNGEEGVQPEYVPSRMGLFVLSCPLFEILADILAYFYNDDCGNGYPKHLGSELCNKEILTRVLDFNRRLDNLFDSIPGYLQTTKITRTNVDKNNSVNLQQQVLYCRFLYVRVLSLRPLLLLATRREHHSSSRVLEKSHLSLDEELIRSCCNLCVVTAHEIIESIHEHLDTAYKSSGWHSVYFTFASITILLAARQCPYVDTDNGNDLFETSWNCCLSILEHYKDQIHSATQAIHVLQVLRSRIFRAETRGGTPEVAINDHNGGPEVSLADSVQSLQIPPALDASDQFDLSTFNPYGAEFIADAWFGQQITNLDLFFPS